MAQPALEVYDSVFDNPDIRIEPPKIPVEDLAKCLEDEQEPIAKRMRTVFLLKQIQGEDAILALQRGMTSQSILLKHEIAYVLGQLQDPFAVPFLEETLKNVNEHSIVRHECAEALAAIGLPSSLELLAFYAKDEATPAEVRDTCQLSLDMIEWKKQHEEKVKSKYYSVDPAPPFTKSEYKSVADLEAILLDQSRSMFDRYRAMFALRNLDNEEAVLALSKGFNDPSALFKHEIAFVFGQMQHRASIPALMEMLARDDEHAMVRHEAAEALGSTASANECDEDVLPVLNEYVTVDCKDDKSSNTIIKESCLVALDIHEYWTTDQFDSAL